MAKKIKKAKKALKKKIIRRKKKTVRKIIRKKPVIKKKKPAIKKAAAPKKPKENILGKVTHYFPHVRAAVIKLKAPLAIGDTLKIKGHTTDFTQTVTSMQVNHVPVTSAKKGQEIGLLVNSRVRQHDTAYKG